MGDLVNPDGTPWVPAFEGQRPPFQPNNQLAVTHGAYSAKRTDPIARRLIDEVCTDPTTSYLASPKYHAQLWQWAVAQARVEVLTEYVDELGMAAAMDSDRGKTPPVEVLRKWMATSLTLARDLGFTPASAARLGKDVASTQVDLATLLSKRDRTEGTQGKTVD